MRQISSVVCVDIIWKSEFVYLFKKYLWILLLYLFFPTVKKKYDKDRIKIQALTLT